MSLRGKTDQITGSRLVHYPACKICRSDAPDILISLPFLSSTIWDFLQSYYKGRVERAPFEGELFEVRHCQSCGFLWQARILDAALMGDLYGRWIDPLGSYDRKRGSPASYFKAFAVEVQAISLLFPRRPVEVDVLDFGMGWGLWCLMAKAHGFNARGFEISQDRVARARSNGIEVIEDFDQLLTMNFDFVNAEQVFEHIENPLSTMRSLASILKPKGILKLAVPNGEGMDKAARRKDWKPAKDALHPLEHINCFNFRSLARLGEEAGLKVIRAPIVAHDAKSFVKKALGPLAPGPRGTSLYYIKA